MPIISTSRFRKMARKGEAIPAGSIVHKQLSMGGPPEVVGDRVLRFVASTARVDREYDVIQQNWELDDYRLNPVVLLNHDARNYPIGRAVDVGVVDGALHVSVEFVPPDVPEAGPRAEAAFQLVKRGFLAATSVGLDPLEYELADDEQRAAHMGLNFIRSTLCEVSVVCVPANPDALYDPTQIEPQEVPVGIPPPTITEPLRAAEPDVTKDALSEIVATVIEAEDAAMQAAAEDPENAAHLLRSIQAARARRRRALELITLG